MKCFDSDDPYSLERAITSDEIWIYAYAGETKSQSFQQQTRSKKARQGSLKFESFAHYFLRSQWCGSIVSSCQNVVRSMGYLTTGKRRSDMRNNQLWMLHTPLLINNSWLKTTPLSCFSHHIHWS